MSSDKTRFVLLNLAVAFAYAASGILGLWLGSIEGRVTVIWPPTGIALAAAYLFGVRIWPGLALGAVVATLCTGAPLGFALMTMVGNPLPAMATLWMVRRFRAGQQPGLHDVTDAVLLLGVGALLTPLISSGIGVLALWLNDMIPAGACIVKTLTSWYIGDAVGAAVLAPVLIVLWQQRQKECALRRRPLEALTLMGAMLPLGWLVITQDIASSPFFFIIAFPLMVWAALRFDVLTTVLLALVIDVITAGSLMVLSSGMSVTALPILGVQLAVMAISMTGLILAMAVAERDKAQQAQKATIDQLRSEAEDLAQTREALTQANLDLQRFAEVTAHHLQEPARRMASYAERLTTQLKGRIDDDEARLSLGFIGQQARRQQNLLHDVERYLTAGLPRGPLELCDANAVVIRLMKRMSNRISASGAILNMDTLPPVWMDRTRLTDVFEVLMDNALRYGTPHCCWSDSEPTHLLTSSGADAPTTPLRIAIDGQRVGDKVRYSVSDNGPGIEMQYRERVFVVFERLATSHRGTGIGLAIVRRITESCGGHAWIEDTQDGGCRVLFELPAKEMP